MEIEVHGNIESLKDTILIELKELYDMEVSRQEFVPAELAARIADITSRINREISVFINRKGKILDISIGDHKTVTLPIVEGRRGKSRLSGIRCIHTHPNGDGRPSDVDMSSLYSLRLDAMIAVGVWEGLVKSIYTALPAQPDKAEIIGPYNLMDDELNDIFDRIIEIEGNLPDEPYQIAAGNERAILVGVETPSKQGFKNESQNSLDELEELALTAGATVVEKILQRKAVKDPAYLIGRGKAEELNLLRQSLNADVIIFDEELSGAQVRNIEEIVGAKVIDRTTLILDIFAQRARSKEGKLQVELAQLKYRLPRLIGLGNQLSRLGGGIGTRGPGEKKLEVDRRHIRRRIGFLEAELKDISRRRGYIREGRKNNSIPSVALVGYTNAGKSTLLNSLCHSDVFAEDKLFATLDPTARMLRLPDGREIMLIDTVGFIRKLPHDLVEAFKSTLEEAIYADALLHVVDAANPEAEEQVTVVEGILDELGAANKDMIIVLNKADRAQGEVRMPQTGKNSRVYSVSALSGLGLEHLVEGIGEVLPPAEEEVTLLAPYSEGWIAPYIYQNGRVLSEDYVEDGVLIKASVRKSKIEKIRYYLK